MFLPWSIDVFLRHAFDLEVAAAQRDRHVERGDAGATWFTESLRRGGGARYMRALSLFIDGRSRKLACLGVSSHAASAPERGRSALDGVEAMNHMVNMLRETLPADSRPLASASQIQPFDSTESVDPVSSDAGDVSWVVPTASLNAATSVPGTAAHSWQAVAAGGMSIGEKGMLVAAKTLARTAIDLYADPDLLAAARAERAERVGTDFAYRPLLGDRPPALDYREAPSR